MAAPDTQQSSRIVADAPEPLETAAPGQDDGREVSSLLDAALKDVFIMVGTIWFIATLVAIGAFALGWQLVAAIAVVVVVTMMFSWLAGLCFLFVNWAERRFDFIAVLTRW